MTGERIRALRKQAGLKQSELGRKLGISASAIGMYENNRRVPPRQILLQLCDIFHVTADYLLCERNKPADLGEELDALHDKLRRQEGLMFHGRPVSQEDLEQVFRAAWLGAELIRSEEEDTD